MDLAFARSLYPEMRQLAELVSDEWCESYNTKEQHAEICVRNGLTGEVSPIATIHPDCAYDDRQLMIKSPLFLRAALCLLNEAFARIRDAQPAEAEGKSDRGTKNFAAECAMLCQKPAFRAYLRECHDLVDASDDERVNTRVRSILKIQSRADLNADEGAGMRWASLRRDFDNWRKRP